MSDLIVRRTKLKVMTFFFHFLCDLITKYYPNKEKQPLEHTPVRLKVLHLTPFANSNALCSDIVGQTLLHPPAAPLWDQLVSKTSPLPGPHHPADPFYLLIFLKAFNELFLYTFPLNGICVFACATNASKSMVLKFIPRLWSLCSPYSPWN